MKLTLILWITILLNVHAETGRAQNINLSVKSASLESIFENISEQTGYHFLYNIQMLQATKPLTFSVKNTSLEKVMQLCLKDQGLTYTISANTVVVKRSSEAKNILAAFSDKVLTGPFIETAKVQKTVSGTVIDRLTKETLPGVSIKVKNTTTGVSTDGSGKFTITAANTDVLVASYVGYETQEASVGSDTKIDFTLNQSLNNLNEVVVVGYGTQEKRDVTGAITSVNSRQIMERTPINIYEALQGQSPGVQVDQSSGAPGASSSVIIRGIGTFGNGAAPLYIVDGAQGVNIDAINPMDVESVDILKDAASASIYGARGANGVIIITTKRGKSGKPVVNANFVTSYGTLSHKVASANAAERRIYERKLQGGTAGSIPTDSLNPGMNADVDALDAVTRTARKNDATVSLSGGSDNLTFFGSFNYVEDESIILNSWSKQARLRANIDYRATEKFSFGTSFTFGLRNGNRVLESSTLNEAYARNPTYALYLPDGSLTGTIAGRQNPVAWALYYKNLQKTYSGTIYNKADYKFNKNFMLTADATLGYGTDHTLQFTPNRLSGAGVAVNTGSDQSQVNTNWLAQTYLSYNQTFGDHILSGVAGVSAEKRWNSNMRIVGNTYVTDEVLTLNSAQTYGNPTNAETANTAVGSWARLGYNYKRKYQINATIRADGSSRFGPANRWGYFPSVGAAWTFSDESFMAWSGKALLNGKLRVSYGITGNDQIGNYDAIQTYTFGSNFYNGVSGVVLNSNFGNPNLSWEENKQLNIGTDLTFFDGRASVSIDYYNKITDRLLYSAPLVVETGFASVNVNTGSIQNRGLELVVAGYPIRRDNFQWNISYNMSFNKGKVLKLVNGTPILSGQGSLTQEGHPLGDFYGWKQLGVFAYDQSNAFGDNWERLTPVFNGSTFAGYTLDGQPYTGNIKKKESNGVVAVGGDVDWEDLDKNGIINDADRSILGNAQPAWIAGISNNFNYKDFNLSVVVYGSMGGQVYNAIDASQSRYGETGVTPRPYIIYNAWDKQGDITDVPDAKLASPIGNTRMISSRYIEDGSWIRLRNVKLSYSMPPKLASYIGAKRVVISASGNNLLTWSKYIGFDPEMSFTNPLQMGVESTSRIPRKNEWIFGVNVNF